MKVGVIGLGAMGSRLAKNFLDEGKDVFVFNRTKSRAEELIENGAKWCDSPKAVAESSDVIITVLTNDDASKIVWLDAEIGLINGLSPGKVAMECSTISHRWALDLANEMSGFNYLEAPLVGSRPQAEAKQLTILVAGKSENYEKIKGLLQDTSAKSSLVGEHGKAIALKLVINTLFGIQTAALAELYNTLLNSGFEKEKLMGILPSLPVTSPIMQMMLELFAREDFDPLFPIELVEKDFGYAKEFIKDSGTEAHMTSSTQVLYKNATKANLGDQNISGILNYYRKE